MFRRLSARWSRFWGYPSYFLLQHMSLLYKGKNHVLSLKPFFRLELICDAIVANKASYIISVSCLYIVQKYTCTSLSRNVTMTPLPVLAGKRQFHTCLAFFAHFKQVIGKCWISLFVNPNFLDKLIISQLYSRLLNYKVLIVVHLGGKKP